MHFVRGIGVGMPVIKYYCLWSNTGGATGAKLIKWVGHIDDVHHGPEVTTCTL